MKMMFILMASAVTWLQSCPSKQPAEPERKRGMAGPHLAKIPRPGQELVVTITSTNPDDQIIPIDNRTGDSIQSMDHPILIGDTVWSNGITCHVDTLRKYLKKKEFKELMAEIKAKQF